jgi:hypothetical protein
LLEWYWTAVTKFPMLIWNYQLWCCENPYSLPIFLFYVQTICCRVPSVPGAAYRRFLLLTSHNYVVHFGTCNLVQFVPIRSAVWNSADWI